MCRLSAISSKDYFSVMDNILALETMKEGHDGSGLGVVLKDIGGEFKDLKDYPILSGICIGDGRKKLDEFMEHQGFKVKLMWEQQINEKPKSPVQKR